MVAGRGKSFGQQLRELFAKVGSSYPMRENFRLTQEVKDKFTEKLRLDPKAFWGTRGSQARDFRVNVPKIRLVPSPEARLRTLTQGADHAEAFANQVRGRVDPVLLALYSLRTRIATAAVSLLAIWLLVHVMLGSNGMVVYRAKRSEYQQLQKEIDRLQRDNTQFSSQIDQLKTDPKRIEKEAREQFHYARPGEVIYVSPPPPAVQAPATRSASKR